MKVLIVEDHDGIAEAITERLGASGRGGEAIVARGAREARDLYDAGPFDFVVCDRKIPGEAGVLSVADEVHGDAVITEVMQRFPGTPLVVFTAFRNTELLQRLLDATRTGDPFGEGKQRPLIRCFDKTFLSDCLTEIGEMAQQVRVLEDIEVSVGGMPTGGRLRSTEVRLLRMFARLKNGSQVRVEPIGGGLSNTVTLRVRVTDAHGGHCASAFAKIGKLGLLAEEHQRYSAFIPASLPGWAYAPLAERIESGAGDVGGLFYTLGEGDASSLLSVILATPDRGAALVRQLEELFTPWHRGAANSWTTVREVRRAFVDDVRARTLVGGLLEDEEWESFEDRKLIVRQCTQHGDLHGENVLVSSAGDLMVIDYGDVKRANACVDMVVLELSLLFHPSSARARWEWPTLEQAQSWNEVAAYSLGSPVAPVIEACRSSAHRLAAGPREVFATAYGYALRQLKYDDTPKELARAILRAAKSGFEAT